MGLRNNRRLFSTCAISYRMLYEYPISVSLHIGGQIVEEQDRQCSTT
jgi:hypothetical protein